MSERMPLSYTGPYMYRANGMMARSTCYFFHLQKTEQFINIYVVLNTALTGLDRKRMSERMPLSYTGPYIYRANGMMARSTGYFFHLQKTEQKKRPLLTI
jgi:hypothetical protein